MEKSERRKRFERVASYRVQKILDDIHSLNRCSIKNNYEYSESDVEQMFSEISKAVQESRAVYLCMLKKSKKHGFSFKKI